MGEQDSLGVEADNTSGMRARSLLVRVGAAMTGIAVMALASMLASIIIAQTATGDAEAINKAGTLRMQAYRLADAIRSDSDQQRLAKYTQRFKQTLDAPALLRMIPEDTSDSLRQRYASLRGQWTDQLQPAIRSGKADRQQAYLSAVPGFVRDIDALVGALEEAAAERIQLLRFGQGVALFVTIALIFFTLFRLINEVLPGIRELMSAVAAAQGGDLSRRTRYRGDDEIGALARTFNGMADNLQAMYQQLEARVADKTARLSQSNDALQLLYDTAERTARGDDRAPDWRPIVAGIQSRLGTGPVTLYLTDTNSDALVRISHDAVEPLADLADATRQLPERTIKRGDGGLRVPVAEGDQCYGYLDVAGDDGALTDWQRRLIETVAGHIATARARRRREAERRRLALMEERSAIARELHDSLAQALSYLKIQTTRLERELGGQTNARARAVVTELRDGLNNAYRQLRELLHTFRLKLGAGGARAALVDTVEEFGARGQLPIGLTWQAPADGLGPNEELHVVQIVREALANVVQHAQASRAHVTVTGDANHITVYITDDGQGPPATVDRENHHGITIMRERAHSVGGELSVEPVCNGGTQVTFVFNPQSVSGATTQEQAP